MLERVANVGKGHMSCALDVMQPGASLSLVQACKPDCSKLATKLVGETHRWLPARLRDSEPAYIWCSITPCASRPLTDRNCAAPTFLPLVTVSRSSMQVTHRTGRYQMAGVGR